MTPTQEQLDAVAFTKASSSNLLLQALAGCAKTTTLEQIIVTMPQQRKLYLTFNKRTADEASRRLSAVPNIDVRTINALGHRAWLSKTGRNRHMVSSSKLYYLCKDLNINPQTAKAVGIAKMIGYAPKPAVFSIPATWEEIIETASIDSVHYFDVSPTDCQLLLAESIKAAFEGSLDFNDQIYMSCCYGATFPRYDAIFIDETQDLSPMNHQMVKRLTSSNPRVIAVGDRNQSIYAFRGADSNSIDTLQQTYSMEELPLTINFRCSKAVVKHVRKTTPELQWCDTAPKGSVTRHSEWKLEDIPNGSAILCRNNAPLFSIGVKLLATQRPTTVFGNSSVQFVLGKLLTSFGGDETNTSRALRQLSAYEEAMPQVAAIQDRVDSARALLTAGDTIGEAKSMLRSLCSKRNAEVTLSTGHKAKGFEWSSVHILNRSLIPSPYARTEKALQQETNLLYVLRTRAKVDLHYIDSHHLSTTTER